MAKARALVTATFCLALFVSASEGLSRPSSIVLENNEFKHILVAINDNVADDPTLVQTIKDTFTKASAFLYAATNQRAVFRDVTILVPSTWSNNNNAYAKATSQVFNDADIIITAPASPPPSPDDVHIGKRSSGVQGSPYFHKRRSTRSSDSGQSPFVHRQPAMTKAYAGCGHQGIRIILGTDVLTDRRLAGSLGPPEKILVHEWAHFRWGVFDEYALEAEPQFYFSPSTGDLEGVRCTELIKGILTRTDPATGKREYCRALDPNTGLWPVGCHFMPYPAGPYVAGLEASIMDHVNIKPISKFCNDNSSNNATKHNYDAPSRHNRLCAHRSTWDVISSSQDFSNEANPTRSGMDTAPIFDVVQAGTSRRLVLALDTSQSMGDDEKLTRMKQAVATFIQEGVAPATEVGLTTFSDDSQVKRALQALNTTHDRQSFADDLPDTESGATDITLALTSAAKLLQISKPTPETPEAKTTISSSSSTNSSLPPSRHSRELPTRSRHASGGHVVVVTDGRETSGTKLTSALPVLRSASVAVSFVVLGGPPQPELEHLAYNTGGRVYCDSNLHSSTAATDAFFTMLQSSSTTPSATPTPIQILSQAEGLSQHGSLDGYFSIDEDLGSKTAFLVAYDVMVPEVSVRSPSGRVYSHIYPEYSLDHRLQMAKIAIPGTAESGRWWYKITNPAGYQRISFLVISSPVRTTSHPVLMSGTLIQKKQTLPLTMHIFAEVTRGDNPVIGMRVTALVTMPDGSLENVALMDNGAGADIVENDGVYSRYFSKLSDPGLYTVRVAATGHVDHKAADTAPIDPRDVFVQRSVSAGYVVITPNNKTKPSPAHAGDREAPVRISDLRVVKTSSKNRTVMLSWRASGDDTDRDTGNC
ncbi:hypothetical protein V1264_024923 [Littorina saxatilis]|uniref:VWFA domain-containing protein n=1 Tax=Littorina saxatilis TaxID=31220 RepID=A0AAN9ALJ1_9CAEN